MYTYTYMTTISNANPEYLHVYFQYHHHSIPVYVYPSLACTYVCMYTYVHKWINIYVICIYKIYICIPVYVYLSLAWHYPRQNLPLLYKFHSLQDFWMHSPLVCPARQWMWADSSSEPYLSLLWLQKDWG
jgi:hypothetical protein